jgi:hypothetical protein
VQLVVARRQALQAGLALGVGLLGIPAAAAAAAGLPLRSGRTVKILPK